MMRFPIVIQIVKPGDARGWIGFGCWLLVILILAMVLFDRKLLDSDAFLILATAIVITGWVQGPVSWAYAATKGGGELADSNARLLEEQAATTAKKDTAAARAGTASAAAAAELEASRPPTGTPENPTVIEGVHGGETVTIKPEPKKT